MEKKVNVLIVDDDRAMVKTLCDILDIKGYAPVEAFNGEEALEKVTTTAPDCVLMDIKMPGINGVEALKRIKNKSPDLPVVLMSAYATEELERDARHQGADAVLTKPIDLKMVLSFLSLLREEEKILIVDEDPVFCKMLLDVLQARGYRAAVEVNPENVMGRLKQSYQLAVILDPELCRADSSVVLRSIRAAYPTKPVILVPSCRNGMSDSLAKSLRIGAYSCFGKPLEVEALLSSVEEIRRKKRRYVLSEEFRWGKP